METNKLKFITREKHLDHMVKVVPFIVTCYAVQCFIIWQMSPTLFSQVSLMFLGCFLAAMILSFIIYDLKHKVAFSEESLTISFFYWSKTVFYDEIWKIDVKEEGQPFSTVTIRTHSGKFSFYLIDHAEEVKKFIESRTKKTLLAA